MNTFQVHALAAAMMNLQNVANSCEHIEQRQGKGSPADNNLLYLVRLTLTNLSELASTVQSTTKGSVAFECGSGAVTALVNIDRERDVTTIKSHFTSLGSALLRDALKNEFLVIDPVKCRCVDNQRQFDSAAVNVRRSFPSAVADIVEAGNCLAAECNTAAVFHLMRVAEHGLRALAHDRRIRLAKNKPIELGSWEDLIKKLEDAEAVIQNYPKTMAREAQFVFYHSAMMEVRRFKNIFRNRLAHTRDSYDRYQAQSVFDHVKAFIQILALHISEGRRTPVIWKGKKWIKVKI